MSYACGTTTFGTAGTKTFTTTFQPTWVRVTMGALFGGAETGLIHGCQGRSDGTHTSCNYFYSDATLQQCDNSSTKIVSHWENQSGILVEVVDCTFNSFLTTGVKFNVVTADANYQAFVECGA